MIDYKAIANIFNTVSQSTNIVVTVASWIFIMPLIFEGKGKSNSWAYKVDMSLIHSLPLMFTTINLFILSDTTIYYSDLWIVCLFMGKYLHRTYIYTMITGEHIYPFLTWEEDDDYSTYFSIAMVILGVATHLSIAFLSQLIRGRSEL